MRVFEFSERRKKLSPSSERKNLTSLETFHLQKKKLGAAWDAIEKSTTLDQWFPFGLFSGLFTATLVGYVLLGVSDVGLD